jgi:hypothetical protein
MVCNSSRNRGNVGANPSIRRTATGYPVAAAHVKRVCQAWHRAWGKKGPLLHC